MAPVKVIAAVAPAPKPRPVVKAEPAPAAPPAVAKTTGNYPKADWLVIEAPEKKVAAAEPKEEAPPPPKPRAYAKAERDLLLRDYNAYVIRKSSDPYSNLK